MQRSFESGFADALIERLRVATGAEVLQEREDGARQRIAEIAANSAIVKDNGVSSGRRVGSYERAWRDRKAAAAGKAAAQGLSLVMRSPRGRDCNGAGADRGGVEAGQLPFSF